MTHMPSSGGAHHVIVTSSCPIAADRTSLDVTICSNGTWQETDRAKPNPVPAMDKIPLNYEASVGDTHKQITNCLPQAVVQCLQNARFVSLFPRRHRRFWTGHMNLTLNFIKIIAPSCDMHRKRAQCLAHELYLPPLITVLGRPGDCHDDEPPIAEDYQHHSKPSRISTCT